MKVYKFTSIDPKGEEFSFDTETTHPAGKIELLDGSLIEGFPRQTPIQVADNTMSLDTTGEYFQIRRKKPKIQKEQDAVKAERMRLEKLFYENAFFFLLHKKEILGDSRMFLTPLPVMGGLAYTGSSGFMNPTLGVCVEWWNYYGASRLVSDDGLTELIWYIAGSPLSGSNRCSVVNDKGVTRTVQVTPFSDTWRSFIAINIRYDECKEQYEAYSLEETLELLHRTPTDDDTYMRFLSEIRIAGLQRLMRQKKKYLDQLSQEKSSVWNKYLKFSLAKEVDRLKKLLDDSNEGARIREEKIDKETTKSDE